MNIPFHLRLRKFPDSLPLLRTAEYRYSSLFELVDSVIVLAAPIDARSDFCLLGQLHTFHDVFEKFLISRSVHDVTDMFLAFESVLVNILLYIRVAVLNNLENALLVGPADEVLRETRVLLYF